jgi:MoaA/NifB/PqqE/SkfB family radical SAM enzyme
VNEAPRYRPAPRTYEAEGAFKLRAGGEQAELRLLLACDQRCYFCNCDEHAPNLVSGTEAAARALHSLRASGADRLVLTGGEPTLRKDLAQLVAFSRTLGFRRVTLQTNGMRLGEKGLAARLKRAGLDDLFASLHSSRPGVSDFLTGEPGGFDRTLRGLDASIAAGLRVTLNFVATADNLLELPGFIGWAGERFEGGLDGVALSFMSPVAAARANFERIPRLGAASAAFRAALEAGRGLGVRVRVSGVCGIPLCQVKGFESSSDEADNAAGRPLAVDRRFGERCEPCGFKDRCSGFWNEYLDRWGDAELEPLPRGVPA